MNIEKYLTRACMLTECGFSINEAVAKVKKTYEEDKKTEYDKWSKEVLKNN